MTKQLKLGKSSFTLLETLLSILIFSIIIVSFLKLSYYDNFEEEFVTLNKLDNYFTKNAFSSNFTKTLKTITIIENETLKKDIKINEINYIDENISIRKYELLK